MLILSSSAAVQPLFGQLANIFGRRKVTLIIVALFTFGSGICGGAHNGTMLIAGRAVQGMGAGGINVGSLLRVTEILHMDVQDSLLKHTGPGFLPEFWLMK